MLTLVVTVNLLAAQEPKPLTEEQKARLKERDQYEAEANRQEKAGKIPEAIAAAEKMLAIEREVFGNRNEDVVESLEMLARLHEHREDWAAGRKARLEVVSIRMGLYGKDDWRVTDARLGMAHLELLAKLDDPGRQKVRRAEALNDQVFALWSQGRSREALPLVRESLKLRRQVLGEQHPAYIQSLFNLAAQHNALAQYREAEPLYLKARDLRKKLQGENHPDYAVSLHDLAALYLDMGDYPKALPLFEQARDLRKKLLGENHPDYAVSLNDLAALYQAMGDYSKALPLFEQARDLRKKLLGENHTAFALSLNNLAALYQAMGDYPKALPLFEQTRDLRKKLLGENHSDYATSLSSLGVLYQAMGDYGKALPLFEQARDLRKKLLGENHPDYPLSLNNLASLYQAMGDYPKALPLFEQARELHKKLLGENHPDYARSLNNLAALYLAMGDYPKGLPLLEEARDLRKKLLGENHPDYARSLNNLAVLYQDMGDYPKALPLFEQARDLRKKLLGENHPAYALSLNNLAALYQDMGDYPKALPLFEQARDLRKKLLGENHPDYATTLNDIAGLYKAMGDYPKALPMIRQALELRVCFWQENIQSVGERQRLRLLDSVRSELNNYLIAALATRASATDVYDVVLPWKGAVAAHQNTEVFLRDKPDLQFLLRRLDSVRAQLAKRAFDLPSPAQRDAWLRNLDQLRNDKEQLEAEMARAAKDFPALRRSPPSLNQVRKALPRQAVLIDFVVRSTGILPKERTGKEDLKNHLLAFVVQSDRDEIRLLDLGDLPPIEGKVEAWRQAVRSNDGKALDAAANQLHRLVWQPLQPHLGEARVVLISPDGPLARFPFAALPGKAPGSFLLEDLTLGYVSSGRQLVDFTQPDDPPNGPAGLLALGALDYDRAPGGKDLFGPLPGTGLEADRVLALFAKRFPDQHQTLLRGAEPTLDKVRAELKRRPAYLHLATHGFFESPARLAGMLSAIRHSDRDLNPVQRQAQADVLDLLPLLKSGLVLAGANRAGNAALLTAEDLAGIDLRGCELVVLSACETSLGELSRNEGVLGLQRNFHAAGARSVAASLWQVNDAATSVLMEQFYTNLWHQDKPLGKLEALRQAQLFVLRNPDKVRARTEELKAEAAKRGILGDVATDLPDGGKIEPAAKRSPPAWWAALVLSGDGRATKP